VNVHKVSFLLLEKFNVCHKSEKFSFILINHILFKSDKLSATQLLGSQGQQM